MLRIGIAGIGFMGMIHFLAYRKVSGVKVVALCEQDETRLAGDWRSIKGNFGPPGKMMDLSGIATTPRLEKLLADPRIDVVDVCLPPNLHADVAVAALRAGKHVFCEKPIALSTTDAKRMVAAANKAGKLLLIGHVLPFFPEFAFARKTVAGGKYGRLIGAQFKRIISDPLWLPNYYDPARIGGPLLDLNIHDAHFIRLLCGMPRAVYSRGRMRGDVAEFFNTQFLFDDPGLAVTLTGGVIGQQGRAFNHAYEIYLERATLLFDFAVVDGQPKVATPVTLLDQKGKVHQPELGGGDPIDAFAAEIKEVARAVRGGGSDILGGDLARDAVVLCHKQTESVATGKMVKV